MARLNDIFTARKITFGAKVGAWHCCGLAAWAVGGLRCALHWGLRALPGSRCSPVAVHAVHSQKTSIDMATNMPCPQNPSLARY